MTQTARRVPPLAPESSFFNTSEDADNLLADAKQSLYCLIWLIEGYDARGGNGRLEEIRRVDLACLLRLIGLKIEHAETVYHTSLGNAPPTAARAN